MATTGQIFPGSVVTAAEDPWLDNDWVTPEAVTADDTTYAQIIHPSYDDPDQSFVLKAYNFDFSSIPAGSTINGVTVRVRAWYAAGANSIDLMQLLDTARAKVGTNKAATPTALTTSEATYTFGGVADLWGNALTLAWIQDPDFGVAYGVLATAANADTFADWITIEVEYTAPAPKQTSVAEISLASATDPADNTNHSIVVRARTTTGATGTIRAALYEGASNRSGDLESTPLTNALADYTLAIPQASAANITDYSNLSIRLWGYDSGGAALVFEVAELYLQIPAAAATIVSLACTVAGTSSVTPALSATRELSSSIPGTSSVTPDLTTQLALEATVAGVGTVTPDLARTVPIATTVVGTSAVSGDIALVKDLAAVIVGVSTITVSELARTAELAVAISGVGTITVAFARDVPIAVAVVGTSTIDFDFVTARELATVVSGISTVTGDLGLSKEIATIVVGVSTVTVSELTRTAELATLVTGTGNISAALAREVPIAAVVAGLSTVEGALSGTRGLATTVAGNSSIAADFQTSIPLVSVVAGTSTVTGQLTGTIGLEALIVGNSAILPALGYDGPVPLTRAQERRRMYQRWRRVITV